MPRNEREAAREFWQALSTASKNQIGDDLVLEGTFDWLEYGFHKRPSSAFLNALDYERTLWEQLQQ